MEVPVVLGCAGIAEYSRRQLKGLDMKYRAERNEFVQSASLAVSLLIWPLLFRRIVGKHKWAWIGALWFTIMVANEMIMNDNPNSRYGSLTSANVVISAAFACGSLLAVINRGRNIPSKGAAILLWSLVLALVL